MFSVVIPLYNKANTIERTLSTVLTQTYKKFEVLIVNDGSTDSSEEIIRSFSNDPRIRIINQQNMGVSASRNNGVLHANYDYIAFLDGDDEWLPYFLEIIKEAIETFPDAGMFGTSSWHRDIRTGIAGDSTLKKYRNKINLVEYFENPHTMPHTSATVVSKKVFNKIENGQGFPIGMKCCEDLACFHRMALLAPVVYVGFPLGIRNNNVDGQITGKSKDEIFKLQKYVALFYNLSYKFMQKNSKDSRIYKLFFKYDIRGRFIAALRENDFKTLNFYLNNLDKELLDNFYDIELWLYKQEKLILISKMYILITKIWWRRFGFPIVGH